MEHATHNYYLRRYFTPYGLLSPVSCQLYPCEFSVVHCSTSLATASPEQTLNITLTNKPEFLRKKSNFNYNL